MVVSSSPLLSYTGCMAVYRPLFSEENIYKREFRKIPMVEACSEKGRGGISYGKHVKEVKRGGFYLYVGSVRWMSGGRGIQGLSALREMNMKCHVCGGYEWKKGKKKKRMQVVRMSPDEERLTRRSPLEFPVRSNGSLREGWGDITSLNSWIVGDYYRLVESVNSFELSIQRLSDQQLSSKTIEFRRRYRAGEPLEAIQAESFSVVREAARRKLGMRHFDVQIVGGAVLHDGSIVEMKTGEGKTLASTLAAYLNALTDKGVHVVTVNDYLAQRDAQWMGQVYRFLGLSVGLIQSGMTQEEKNINYKCDITYTNNSELGFDYLRDNLTGSIEEMAMRWPNPFNFAILDEVDSVLIDEGRNPLLISGEVNKDTARYPVAAQVADLLLRGSHYNVEMKDSSVELTEEGIELAEKALVTGDLWDEDDPWARLLINALKAKEFYHRNVEYIVKNGNALIINQLTGRIEEKKRWSDGIHQAVEAKEGLKIQPDSVVIAQITYQSLFKLYPKLAGMTGTAKTEEKEFLKMFNLPVIEIPTHLTNIRNDLPIQAFATAKGKWENARNEVEGMFRKGRPVLVGTTSVENSEYLSNLLNEWGIPHNVLNARPKHAEREAEIIAQAGRKHAVTISTNMAGRGTDIILGGNPKMLAKKVIEDYMISNRVLQEGKSECIEYREQVIPSIGLCSTSKELLSKMISTAERDVRCRRRRQSRDEIKKFVFESVTASSGFENFFPGCDLKHAVASAYRSILNDCESHCLKEGMEVKMLGGLHVVGTSLHESRRIDNQLRGRAGRQGDPGSTRFIISLQDEMFQKFNFNTQWAVDLISRFSNGDIIPIEGHLVLNRLLSLQTDVEKFFFSVRKNLVEFDDVLEVQRRHVYALRKSILKADESCSNYIFQYIQSVVDDLILKNTNTSKHPSLWSLDMILAEFTLLGGSILKAPFLEVSEKSLLQSLHIMEKKLSDSSAADVSLFSLPHLPQPHISKPFTYDRWLALSSDDRVKGRYRVVLNLLRRYLGDVLMASYSTAVEDSGFHTSHVHEIERRALLESLDYFWREHLVIMNRLGSAVNIRSFGNRDPLEEYKIDGFRSFLSIITLTRKNALHSLFLFWSSPS